MAWTEASIDTLTALWTEGLSASEIAARLGGVSRNAVIGKVHRLGLAARTSRSVQSRRTRKPHRNACRRAMHKPPRIPRVPLPRGTLDSLPPLGPQPAALITVIDLTSGLCRWPEGDPKEAGFHFCGRAAGEGPYCPHHAARAYRPAPKTKPETAAPTARSRTTLPDCQRAIGGAARSASSPAAALR